MLTVQKLFLGTVSAAFLGLQVSAFSTIEGNVTFQHPSLPQDSQTWYKVVGDLDSDNVPLVTLHGGPGAGHNYLLNLDVLTMRYETPFIFYG